MQHKPLITKFSPLQKPMIIVGTTALQGPSGAGILKAATSLAEKLKRGEDGEDWKVFNVLHKVASQVGLSFHLKIKQFRFPIPIINLIVLVMADGKCQKGFRQCLLAKLNVVNYRNE